MLFGRWLNIIGFKNIFHYLFQSISGHTDGLDNSKKMAFLIT